MIKDNSNPPLVSSSLHACADRAINHHLNPSSPPESPNDGQGLFAVRKGLDAETLLVNASEDLASVQALASHLAFEIDGIPRSVALGICRMVETIQLLVNEALNEHCAGIEK
ncbi:MULTISPECIES: DUF6124 family protein [Pseudomonas fluorescens group]|uniref:DUF3077 domain-containing protein n=1 Tax=Pseudomonas fluorescens TaxID=294 RepID=A0AAE2Q1H9_PSEFL|nr:MULTISPECIES: DUF6124 family protein [Pseudomonas fluorescens group]MBA1429506.1 hypothetical protein [Pseudomonas orientalis]MBD8272009.1 hypothetical protein [Pseudomonas fluorescens]